MQGAKSINSDLVDYDYLIAGGGPAGSSLALRLNESGFKVIIIEKQKFPREKLCGEFVTPECLQYLEDLDVLDEIKKAGAVRIEETCFYSPKGRKLTIPSKWFGASPALGISRSLLDQILLNKAKSGGIEVLENARLVGLAREDRKIKSAIVKFSTGEKIEIAARNFIDATGRSRAVARYLASKTCKKNTSAARWVAFKNHLSNTRCEANTCEIYFFNGGYAGLSHIENGMANLCLIIDSKRLNPALGPVTAIRALMKENSRAKFTLGESAACKEWIGSGVYSYGQPDTRLSAENVAFIGDAASFADPFTGSGLLFALETSDSLARFVRENKTTAIENFSITTGEITKIRSRICCLLRHFAFDAKRAEAAIFIAGISKRLCRSLASATRKSGKSRYDKIYSR
ncbi:MAG TPA: NAD(P)/FAD-dependent oxidoreductase [Pyrinomonadaceae bacterium]|jgi:flavin-dependent dehydrogenase|nr:NAD(P)/FAD-dependent oxidoreductase [Pyrinomonadaceae bacterium]